MCMHIEILALGLLMRNFIFQASRTGGHCITKRSGEPRRPERGMAAAQARVEARATREQAEELSRVLEALGERLGE
jgi:hypothetical protein